MSDPRWQRLMELFESAVGLAPGDRRELVDSLRGEDPSLGIELDRLLEGHGQAGGVLDRPGILAPLLTDEGEAEGGGTIGPYRLLESLGAGGMGVVFRARQEEPIRREVALKLIKAGMDSGEVVARFESERQALALLDHPNIARVLDAGATPEGRPYFVMELVTGSPITRYCDRHRLTVGERLGLFITVCQAVQHAHRRGIIHRDLKPSNVLVAQADGKAVPKVIDFGIAKATGHRLVDHTITVDQRLVGTPEYMSPEQWAASGDIDTRTDVYSLGLLLYRLLVGALPVDETPEGGFRPAFRGPSQSDFPTPSARVSSLGAEVEQIADCRRTDPRALRRQLRGELDWIVMKAAARERDERYDGAAELAADVERHLSGRPIHAGPPSRLYRGRKFVGRHRLGVAVAASVVLLLVGFAVAMAVQAARIRRAFEETQAEHSRAERALARAERVSDFLIELFEVSDPVRPGGEALTTREILDRGAERIAGELSGEPEVQASLMAVMGRVYRHLGYTEPAEELLRQSLAVRRRLLGTDHPEVAAAALALGSLLRDRRDLAAAEEQLREAVRVLRLGPESADEVLGEALDELGVVLYFAGRLDEAEAVLREGLAVRIAAVGRAGEGVGSSLTHLGITLDRKGRYDEAAELLRESVAIGRKNLGPEHANVATRMANLAQTLRHQSRFEEAEIMFREVIELRRKIYGDRHPDVAIGLQALAGLMIDRGEIDEAEGLLRQALAIRLEFFEEDHPEIGEVLNSLGIVLGKQGRHREAAELVARSLQIDLTHYGAEHPSTAIKTYNLARALRRAGDLEAAERETRHAADLLRKAFGERHPTTAIALGGLGDLLAERGDLEGGERLLRDALSIQSEKLPEGHWRTALTHLDLGRCLKNQGRYEESEPLLLEALGVLEGGNGGTPLHVERARSAVVDLYDRWGRPAEADAYRERLAPESRADD